MLGEVGAWGVNLHDNDLVPIDATAAERDRIVREFKAAMQQHGVVVPDGDRQPVHRPDLQGRRLHRQRPAGPRLRACRRRWARWTWAPNSAPTTFVLWGGREGTETDACRRPDEAVKRLREAVNYLCEYNIAQGYQYRFAMEAKPNEPRGDIYMATTGNYLGLHPDARPSRTWWA